jgi:fibronectin type 3 domain-containing protein
VTRRRLALLLLAGLVAGTAAACGRKGPPVPPERRIPAAVQDLSARVVADGVRLAWTLPRIRADRSPLREVRRTEVHRRLETGEAADPPRPAVLAFGGLFGGPPALPGFERVADIVLAEVAPDGPTAVQGGQVAHTDRGGLERGRRYTYVVVAVDEQGRPSAPSNRVVVTVRAAPRTPPGVTAQPGDGEVRLAWEAPARLEDDSPPGEAVVYNVYRGTAPGVRPARPVNPEPLAEPRFVDVGLQNDATYYYSVEALLGGGGPASRPTEAVAATPADATPPAAPRGLVAVVAGASVRLAWEGGGEPDLAGYHVYRSTAAGRDYRRLTEAPQAATTFTDDRVPPGQTYYYVVTAVDRARRPNESVPSAEASATPR